MPISKCANEYSLISKLSRGFDLFHSGEFSMVDGKICSIMTDVGMASCNFCGATPTQMAISKQCKKRPINQRAVRFGLSPLHLWMRCTEFFLKIAYRLKIKMARVPKNSAEKKMEIAEKRRIQKECYERMGGLKVDYPNPKGGNTNDGNTCRRLLRNYEVRVGC